jgi:Flp pilus assembly protein TadB
MSALFFALLFGAGLFLLADGLTARHPTRSTARFSAGQAVRGRLQRFLDRAGLWHVRPWEFLVASLATGLLAALVAGLVLRWPVMTAGAFVGGLLVPALLVAQVADARTGAQQEALPDALGQLKSALQGGLSIQLGLITLEQDGPEALRAELTRLNREATATGNFTLAVAASRERIADPLWDLVTAALLLQDRKGSDSLSAVFDELARAARAELRVLQELRAQRVRTEWSARLLAALPLGLLIAGRLLSPAYFAVFDTADGQLWLALGGVLVVAAYGLMRWIGRPPATPRVLVLG